MSKDANMLVNLDRDERGVVTLTLNRAHVHNAFNEQLISELTHVFTRLDKDESCRLVVITGEGKSFCAGADLNWMKSMVNFSKNENIEDSRKLAQMFDSINSFSKALIAKVNGHALGGGVGIVACSDYVVASEKAKFGFTETRLGLIPAVISPYCIQKIGVSNARAWFLSGEVFNAKKAMEMGLAHETCSHEELDEACEAVVASFLKAAPMATIEAKKLIRNVTSLPKEEILEYTLEAIAKQRVSAEGQEGMKCLLDKSKPSWVEK